MRELQINEDDFLASIVSGGPGCITGILKKTQLESLFEIVPNFSIQDFDIAIINGFLESPVILLQDKKTGQDAVCVRTENMGTIFYRIYNYENSSQNS
ncbi:MAG: hypothetical protein WC548_00880 [Candidatus Pacearchaeota archaeon]